MLQRGASPVIRRHDSPPAVQVDDTNPGGVEQVGQRGAQGFSAGQRLPDADILPDMGEQPFEQRRAA